VFVTLTRQGELRGCIGDLSPREPLADNVVHNTVNAAVSDPNRSAEREVPRTIEAAKTSALGAGRPVAVSASARRAYAPAQVT
jgi:hypothetical protein